MKKIIAKEKIQIESSSESVMRIYRDVDKWSQWDKEIEAAELFGPFAVGTLGKLKPCGGPWTNLTITRLDENGFTDMSKLPFAQLVFDHQIIALGKEVEVEHTISIQGPLAFLFYHLFKAKIGRGLPQALLRLKALAEQNNG